MFGLVVVGADSVGCVLANRLSADGRRKIALIEAGPPAHRLFKVREPTMFTLLWRTRLTGGVTDPQPELGASWRARSGRRICYSCRASDRLTSCGQWASSRGYPDAVR